MLDASRNMCRLCLHNDGKMVYLNESLTLKMSKCTSLLVLPGDGLPRKICQVCLKCLQFCDKFRKQCMTSDEALRKHMKRDRVKKGKSIKRGRREGLRVPPMRRITTDLPDQQEHIKDEQAIEIKEEDVVSMRQNEVTKVLDECDVKEGSNVEEHNAKVKKEDDDSDYIDNLPSPEIFDDDPDCDEPLSLLKLPIEDIKEEEEVTDNGDGKLQDKIEGPSKKKKKMILKKLDNGQKKKPKVIKVQDENGVIKKSFQCDFCGKMFRRSCQFKTHYRIHTGEKPYICSSCPKRFTCGHQLQVHSRTHSKERPYLCRFCGKSFIDHSAVSRHHKIHTDDKKYVCDYCPKRFMTRYDLRKHTATHTGKKFYECAICSQGYTDSSAFAKHKKSHQVIQPSV